MSDDLFDVFVEETEGEQVAAYTLPTSHTSDDKENQVGSGKKRELSGNSEEDENERKKFEQEDFEDWRESEKLPRIKVHKLNCLEGCTHEVALHNDTEYVPLKSDPNTIPAKTYPFVLDPFQKESILCLENQQSVLVSAHTSAGKTVVAEYCIAMSLAKKQRIIYTTPIKALSNQKYREFFEEFKDVGLMTGDVTINPSASLLIMTTEILRSMLYRGSEITREVAWVVFDEIHYMRDKERGVIWEETIILLNDNVHYVFLSATIPNARQFCEWIAYLHKQPCHVVYTDYRPTPLQHYIYPAGGDGIHLVVDENSVFREDNFNKAMMVLKEPSADNQKATMANKRLSRGGANVQGGTSGESNVYKVLQTIMDKNMAPVIVFSFSKKECEAYAIIAAKSDYNSDEEKKLVQQVFSNAISILSDEDQKLPQVESVLPILKKGIGIHHSGMLPVLKETIEILFSEGLLKVLFATETFSMGLNMPARTVLFTSCRKWDGKDVRWISSGEYIQMSGRAGRRGLDDKGIVILMIDERMSPAAAKDIVKGQANPLNSAFHLTYNMVLNLLRVEGINPEFMLQRSFYQFQNYANIPSMVEKLKQCEEDYNSIVFEKEHDIAHYYNLRQQIESLRHQLSSIISLPKHIINFMNPGRLVNVINKGINFGWGVVLNFRKRANNKLNDSEPIFTIDTLLYVTKESVKSGYLSEIKPCLDDDGVMHVVPIQTSVIRAVSSVCIYLPQNLQSLDAKQSVWKTLKEIKKRTKGSFPLLDPVEDMGIKDTNLVEIVKKIESVEEQVLANKMHKDPGTADLYKRYEKKALLKNELKQAKNELRQAWSLLQMEDLKCRKRVLRRLGYCTEQDIIDTKGRVACEIDTGEELVLTEMLFNGVFNDMTVSQCVALCSCFVVTENVKEDQPKLSQELAGPYKIMQDTAKRVATVSKECKLDVEIDEYVDKLKPFLMDVMTEWVNGASFAKVCTMTSIFEGNIIRHIRRLEELLRQMSCAAKAIGNTPLEAKFNEGILKIKRDIVFAASLYL
jgi:ATP-dependent RNA helicase DOB1